MGEHDRGRMGVLVGEDCVIIILFSLYLVNNVGFSYEHPDMIAEISAEVIEPYYIELGPFKNIKLEDQSTKYDKKHG